MSLRVLSCVLAAQAAAHESARTHESHRWNVWEVLVTLGQVYEDALTEFVEDGWITESIQVLSSGKEGTVYCCRAGARAAREFVAVKVYRPRQHRTFRHDAIYQQGRYIPDRRLRRAVANKSRVGREVQAESWVGHEYETLQLLHANGAAVP